MPPPLYHIPPTLQQPPRKKTLISLLIKNGEGLKFLFNSIIVLSTLFRRGELCSPAFYCRGFPSRYKLKIIPCTRTNKPNLKGPFSQRGLAPQVTGGSLRICFVSAYVKLCGGSKPPALREEVICLTETKLSDLKYNSCFCIKPYSDSRGRLSLQIEKGADNH